MVQAPRKDPREHHDLNRVISWFITIRWIAGGCVIVAVLLAASVFGYDLPYGALYATVAALLVANLLFAVVFRRYGLERGARKRLDLFFHVQITGDYLFLLLLVYFAGFLESPFAFFFVFHVMLTGFLFSPDVVVRYVVGLVGAIIAVALLENAELIPHYTMAMDAAAYRAVLLPRVVGLVTTIAITGYLITSIKGRIEEKGRRFEVELDRYRQLDKVKSNFILQVTHELRGPVAAVSGFHEMVLRGITGEIAPKTRTVIEKADRRNENLLTIIDEMIDFAYMKSSDEARYDRSILDVGSVVEENLRTHTPHADRKSIRLESEVARGLQLSTNRDLLDIILGNLINNAIKYSPAESEVRVSAEREGREVHIVVSDTGFGIEPEELDKIFEEFYRTRKAREVERDGTGLGLPIVKRAAESLGGRIAVYSELGSGTSFDVYLPVAAEGSDEEDSDH